MSKSIFSPDYRKSEHSLGYKIIMLTSAIVVGAAAVFAAMLVG